MSPYPIQTDRQTIVETARALIERDGAAALSLGRLAAELGIKAPSLYRHIANKQDLLEAVIEQTYLELFAAYDRALDESGPDAEERLLNLARAHRRFAHMYPNAYVLAYTTPNPALPSNPDMLLERAVATQHIMAQISGEADSLAALRGLLALIHGFVSLELNGQLRRGGDLTAVADAIVRAFLRGWRLR